MSPQYLYELADLADPEKLWRLSGIDQRDTLTEAQRKQIDTGVALRRYADYLENLYKAYDQGKSLVLTKIGPSTYTRSIMPTPEEHQRLRDIRNSNNKRESRA